jgi:hypothetical protein
MEDACRRALAEAVVSGEAFHRDAAANREALRHLRQVHRKSGGKAGISEEAMAETIAAQLAGVGSYADFLETPLRIEADSLVDPAERERWMSLPDHVYLEGREYPLDYAFEDGEPVVRARIPPSSSTTSTTETSPSSTARSTGRSRAASATPSAPPRWRKRATRCSASAPRTRLTAPSAAAPSAPPAAGAVRAGDAATPAATAAPAPSATAAARKKEAAAAASATRAAAAPPPAPAADGKAAKAGAGGIDGTLLS